MGPIAVEVVAPMRVSTVRVDAPDHGIVAELTFTARTPRSRSRDRRATTTSAS